MSEITGESFLNKASYVCNAGLQLIGPKTLTCLANGTWSEPTPTCDGEAVGKQYVCSMAVVCVFVCFFAMIKTFRFLLLLMYLLCIRFKLPFIDFW